MIDFSDFMPTLAEVANAPLPEDITIDGRSFYPQILGKKGEPKEWIFMYYWERGRNPLKTRRFTRDKRWKLYESRQRPSPPSSASRLPVGTEKKGGDGKMWVVVEDKKGTKKWRHL